MHLQQYPVHPRRRNASVRVVVYLILHDDHCLFGMHEMICGEMNLTEWMHAYWTIGEKLGF
jgi:hypothetical protein